MEKKVVVTVWEVTPTQSWKSPSFLVPQIPAAMGSSTVGEAKWWFNLRCVLILFRVGAQAPAGITGEFVCTRICGGEFFRDPQLLQEKQNFFFFFFPPSWPYLGVDVVSPGLCPSVAWHKTICSMKPCLNSCYRKYDSKHFKTQLLLILWHALGLCWIKCWQSQGPDTKLEVGFLAFFFSLSLFTILVTS